MSNPTGRIHDPPAWVQVDLVHVPQVGVQGGLDPVHDPPAGLDPLHDPPTGVNAGLDEIDRQVTHKRRSTACLNHVVCMAVQPLEVIEDH